MGRKTSQPIFRAPVKPTQKRRVGVDQPTATPIEKPTQGVLSGDNQAQPKPATPASGPQEHALDTDSPPTREEAPPKLSNKVKAERLPRALQDGIPLDLLPSGWNLNWRAPRGLRDALAKGGIKEVRRVVEQGEAASKNNTRSVTAEAIRRRRYPRPAEKKNTQIAFAVSNEIAAEWQAMARDRDISLAEFVRRMLYARLSVVDNSVSPLKRTALNTTYKAEREIRAQMATAGDAMASDDNDDE